MNIHNMKTRSKREEQQFIEEPAKYYPIVVVGLLPTYVSIGSGVYLLVKHLSLFTFFVGAYLLVFSVMSKNAYL